LRHVAPELDRPYRAHPLILYLGAAVAAGLVSMMVLPASPGHLSPFEFALIGGWMAVGLAGYLVRRAARDMNEEERAYLILGEYR
jgi:hypothetical protein